MKIARLWRKHSVEAMRAGFAAFVACLVLQIGVACLNFVFGWSIDLLSLGGDALSLLSFGIGLLIGLPLFGWIFGGVYKALHAEGEATVNPITKNED